MADGTAVAVFPDWGVAVLVAVFPDWGVGVLVAVFLDRGVDVLVGVVRIGVLVAVLRVGVLVGVRVGSLSARAGLTMTMPSASTIRVIPIRSIVLFMCVLHGLESNYR